MEEGWVVAVTGVSLAVVGMEEDWVVAVTGVGLAVVVMGVG